MVNLLKNNWVTILILALIFVIRIPHMTHNPYEYDSWRQSDTEAIARNFVEHRFNIFFPQLNYDGPLPNYVQLEFQITTFIIAILYKMFGYHYVLARIVPILFFMGSAYYVYLISKHYYNQATAWISLMLYGTFPLVILYSRAIMPESAALFFILGAFYFYSKWISEEKFILLLLSSIFTALAISQKVPTVFIGIPMICMAMVKYRFKMLIRGDLWLFAIIALLPPLVYFKWLETIAEYKFVSGIASKHIFPNMFEALSSKEALAFFEKELPRAFTWWAILLFVFGFLFIRWKKEYAIGVWALAMLMEAAAVVAVIKFNYYLIFLSPVIALLGASVLYNMNKTKVGSIVAIIVITALFWNSYTITQSFMVKQNPELMIQAKYVKELTNKEDLIAVGTDDPSLLNACQRMGWRIGNTYPGNPLEELKYFVTHGAKYFIPLKGYIDGDDGTLMKYLDSHYKKIEVKGGYSFYQLF
jgi:4-amino-4-deoxy-L-arabinose transferase-like glycosyltransferase